MLFGRLIAIFEMDFVGGKNRFRLRGKVFVGVIATLILCLLALCFHGKFMKFNSLMQIKEGKNSNEN